MEVGTLGTHLTLVTLATASPQGASLLLSWLKALNLVMGYLGGRKGKAHC